MVQANSGTNNSSDLQDIATQISALENQLQGTANSTNAQGQYLFAGYSSGTQPFVRGSTGSVSYLGDTRCEQRASQRRHFGADRRCGFKRVHEHTVGQRQLHHGSRQRQHR